MLAKVVTFQIAAELSEIFRTESKPIAARTWRAEVPCCCCCSGLGQDSVWRWVGVMCGGGLGYKRRRAEAVCGGRLGLPGCV